MDPRYRLASRPVARDAAVVRGERFRITVLTDGLLRLEYAADGVVEDRASAFAIVRDLPVPDFRVIDGPDHLEILTERVHLVYDRGPFSASGLSVQVRGNISSYHSIWRFGDVPDDLGGTARTLDNADGAVPLEPGVVSRWGYAVIDDSGSLLLDDEGWVAPRDGSRTDLYVFGYGHDYPAAVRALYAVCGPQPLLPRFALGNWWSRYHRYTADEYTALIERFEAEQIPFSVAVIDMDWHLVDVPSQYGSGWTGYTWDRELFPDPERFLGWLHEHGLRVTLNVHPADGVRAFEDAHPAMMQALGRDPASGDPIAFDVTDPEFLAAYFGVLHRRLEDEGVDFWWLDWQSGPHSRVPGIDPLWMLNHFHFLDSGRDGRRPLTFSRYAGPGSHRYPVGFSGDTLVTWASLAFQPYFTATASNIGFGWWSHDVGGHMFGAKDDELATRWLQLGVFSPILRLHSSHSPFNTKEPWRFGEQARRVMTGWLRLRHRLLPYLHTMNHRAARDGAPLVQPMYWALPEAPEAYQVPNQFSFGTQLLVAPITAPADPALRLGSVTVLLPEGVWTDIFTGLRYDGGRAVVMHRDLDSIPVLAREGAIVPLAGTPGSGPAPVISPVIGPGTSSGISSGISSVTTHVLGNDTGNPQALELLVVPGADGSLELIEDDGRGSGLDESAVARTPIRFDHSAGTLTIGPAYGALGAIPSRRDWTVSFLGLAPGASPVTTVDGASTGSGPSDTPDGATPVTSGSAGRSVVTVHDVPVTSTVRIELGRRRGQDPHAAAGSGGAEVVPNDVPGRLFALLDQAQLPFQLKHRVHHVATADRPLAVRLSHLQALDLDPALATAVSEIVLAQAPPP